MRWENVENNFPRNISKDIYEDNIECAGIMWKIIFQENISKDIYEDNIECVGIMWRRDGGQESSANS